MTASHTPTAPKSTGWVGWIMFTSIMMMVVGVFNVVDGIAAIAADDIFVSGAAGSVVLDVTTWGWVHLILGVVVTIAGFSLLQGSTWARVVAIAVLTINMTTQLLFLPAYPFWSLIIIMLDVLALWALIVHGQEEVG